MAKVPVYQNRVGGLRGRRGPAQLNMPRPATVEQMGMAEARGDAQIAQGGQQLAQGMQSLGGSMAEMDRLRRLRQKEKEDRDRTDFKDKYTQFQAGAADLTNRTLAQQGEAGIEASKAYPEALEKLAMDIGKDLDGRVGELFWGAYDSDRVNRMSTVQKHALLQRHAVAENVHQGFMDQQMQEFVQDSTGPIGQGALLRAMEGQSSSDARNGIPQSKSAENGRNVATAFVAQAVDKHLNEGFPEKAQQTLDMYGKQIDKTQLDDLQKRVKDSQKNADIKAGAQSLADDIVTENPPTNALTIARDLNAALAQVEEQATPEQRDYAMRLVQAKFARAEAEMLEKQEAQYDAGVRQLQENEGNPVAQERIVEHAPIEVQAMLRKSLDAMRNIKPQMTPEQELQQEAIASRAMEAIDLGRRYGAMEGTITTKKQLDVLMNSAQFTAAQRARMYKYFDEPKMVSHQQIKTSINSIRGSQRHQQAKPEEINAIQAFVESHRTPGQEINKGEIDRLVRVYERSGEVVSMRGGIETGREAMTYGEAWEAGVEATWMVDDLEDDEMRRVRREMMARGEIVDTEGEVANANERNFVRRSLGLGAFGQSQLARDAAQRERLQSELFGPMDDAKAAMDSEAFAREAINQAVNEIQLDDSQGQPLRHMAAARAQLERSLKRGIDLNNDSLMTPLWMRRAMNIIGDGAQAKHEAELAKLDDMQEKAEYIRALASQMLSN